MSYQRVLGKLSAGHVLLLDGGTGTELERRGITMDPKAWCGPTTIDNVDTLVEVHKDYIAAGADIITANTYGCSPMMLEYAGYGEQFENITRTAIDAAKRARTESGRPDVLIAGSLSHMIPRAQGQLLSDKSPTPRFSDMLESFSRLANFIREAGCDILLVEMMYHPDRMAPAFKAASQAGLPLWIGMAARRGEDGRVLSFAKHDDIPFETIAEMIRGYDFDVAGIMHSPSDVVGDALEIVRSVFVGPLMAYPDSGYFTMPQWNFIDIIAPSDFAVYAQAWKSAGVQIIGGCCGLGPEHISAISPLKN